MKASLALVGFCAVLLLGPPQEEKSKDTRPESRVHKLVADSAQEWNEAIDRFMDGKHTLSELDEFMKGKYRDQACTHWGGTGRMTVYYLIDDFLQLRADTDGPSLIRIISIEPRRQWVKWPNGDVLIVE